MKIKVSLLGTPKVTVDGHEVSFPYKKAEGLFYYLCVKKSVTRDEIISIFWADCSIETARKNLRDALYHIKRVISNDIISSKGNNRIILSAEGFEPIDFLSITDRNIIDRYTEDFLGYFFISNCLEFEDWVSDVRKELIARYKKALEIQAEEASIKGDGRTLLRLGRALVSRKEYDEDLIRLIISGLRKCGALDEAIGLYDEFSGALRLEYEDEPEEETAELIKEIIYERAEGGNRSVNKGRGENFYLRDKEMLAIMEELYLFNSGGAAYSILFEGESGVGKTAILENLKKSRFLEQFYVVSYRCVEDEKELPLKPWKDILKALDGLGEWETELAGFDRPLSFEYEEAEELFDSPYELFAESVIEKLSADSERGKVVLIIDDIQWLDNASLRLLKNLILWSKNRAMLVIMAMRSEAEVRIRDMVESLGGKGLLRKAEVKCFTVEEVGTIVRNLAPGLLDRTGALGEIYAGTGGNALFLFEYLKEIVVDENTGISRKITDAIQSRLTDLGKGETELLEYISLQPRFATMEEINVMTDGKDVSELIDKLLKRQIITYDRTFNKEGLGFPHQVIKEYVYDRIPKSKKNKLHLKLAEYHEKQFTETGDIGLLPILIHHFREGGDTLRRYKYQLEYLSMFYSVEHELYPTVLATGSTLHIPQLESGDQLVSLVEKIRKLHKKHPETAELRMRAEFLIGRYDLFSGSLKKGLENIHTSIALARELGNDKCLLDNYLQMVFYAIQVANMDMFRDYLESCEELSEKGDFSEADITTVRRLKGLYFMKTGDGGEAKKIFTEVIAATENLHKDDVAYQIGLAACYNYLGEICEEEEDLDNALKNYMFAIRSLEQSELMDSKGAVIYTNAGYLLYRLGRSSQANIYIRKGIRCYEDNAGIWGRSKAYSCAALLSIEKGHWDEAVELYEEAKSNAIKDQNPDSMNMIKKIEDLIKNREKKEKEEK